MSLVLLLPHLRIQNANALSSPYTIGFPAMTAWLGGMHALQRHLNQQGFSKVIFKGIGVSCHSCQLHTYQGSGDFVSYIIGVGKPLNKDGERQSFVEEARCHLRVSLAIDLQNLPSEQHNDFLTAVKGLLQSRLKLAGGDILPLTHTPEIINVGDADSLKLLQRRLMPGYVLKDRRHLMQQAMATGQDALSALLGYLQIHHSSTEDASTGKTRWHSQRLAPGWIVPIATGFQGISPVVKADRQRDAETQHRFAESVITLGEFVMPYRIQSLAELFWYYHVDLEKGLYLCQQNILKNEDG